MVNFACSLRPVVAAAAAAVFAIISRNILMFSFLLFDLFIEFQIYLLWRTDGI